MKLKPLLVCIIAIGLVVVSHGLADDVKRRFPAMALNNWRTDDRAAIAAWTNNRLNSVQSQPSGAAGITKYRIAKDWTKDTLSLDSFSVSINGARFSEPELFDGDAQIFTSGEFRHTIDSYDRSPLSFKLSRSYYFPPEEDFYLVQYTIENPTDSRVPVEVFDYVNSAVADCPLKNYGWYDPNNKLWMVDQTKCGQFYFASGLLGVANPSSFQVGPVTGSSSAFTQWQTIGSLGNNNRYEDMQVQVGTVVPLLLQPKSSISLFFFRTVQPDWNTCVQVANVARAQVPSYWLKKTAMSYQAWLAQGKSPKTLSSDLMALYQNSLLVMKNAQNPQLGTIVASFHPAYLYKVWGRDGMFAAMVFDAAGYYKEAELYMRWMSQNELADTGAFHTCYDWFAGGPVGFVEPQFDSAGAYLLGVYQHFMLKPSANFTVAVLDRIRALEDFFANNLSPQGLAPPDYSIWEESSDPHTGAPLPTAYFTFTQSMANAGVWSAAQMENTLFLDPSKSSKMQHVADTISKAVESNLWLESGGYYARSRWGSDFSLDMRPDASSVAAIFTGMTTNITRIRSHLDVIKRNLTRLDAGIARYWMDPFFYDSIYNPAKGPEVGAPSPPWGVVTMFVAWAELQHGIDISKRLQWMYDHAAPGAMPVGEAIDGVSGKFVMSSCPDIYEHGAVFVWSALLNEKLALPPNPRLWKP